VTSDKGDSTTVRLSDFESSSGEATELPPQEKVRLGLALKILGTLALIFLLAGAALIYGPCERLAQAKDIFDFVKTSVPPIVTLVIGFYFRSESQ
jgi:hypothetical protein